VSENRLVTAGLWPCRRAGRAVLRTGFDAAAGKRWCRAVHQDPWSYATADKQASSRKGSLERLAANGGDRRIGNSTKVIYNGFCRRQKKGSRLVGFFLDFSEVGKLSLSIRSREQVDLLAGERSDCPMIRQLWPIRRQQSDLRCGSRWFVDRHWSP
jgi:hypothetical protein